jgi:hypothetical protein
VTVAVQGQDNLQDSLQDSLEAIRPGVLRVIKGNIGAIRAFNHAVVFSPQERG